MSDDEAGYAPDARDRLAALPEGWVKPVTVRSYQGDARLYTTTGSFEVTATIHVERDLGTLGPAHWRGELKANVDDLLAAYTDGRPHLLDIPDVGRRWVLIKAVQVSPEVDDRVHAEIVDAGPQS